MRTCPFQFDSRVLFLLSFLLRELPLYCNLLSHFRFPTYYIHMNGIKDKIFGVSKKRPMRRVLLYSYASYMKWHANTKNFSPKPSQGYKRGMHAPCTEGRRGGRRFWSWVCLHLVMCTVAHTQQTLPLAFLFYSCSRLHSPHRRISSGTYE